MTIVPTRVVFIRTIVTLYLSGATVANLTTSCCMSATRTDPTLILAFVAVAGALSFSKAASLLGVTKGTVSRKISRLEDQLGVELLRRNTQRVALSSAGRELFDRARGPVRELTAVTSDLPLNDAPLSGEIRLTAPVDIGIGLLPGIVETFSMLHPGVTFNFRFGNEVVDLVEFAQDLAVRVASAPLSSSSLVARRVGNVVMAAYASPSYVARKGLPRTIGDSKHDWIMFTPTKVSTRALASLERRMGAPPRFNAKVRTDDFFCARELLVQGMGVGVLPTFVGNAAVRAGTLLRVGSEQRWLDRGAVYVVTRPRRHVPPQVQAFRTHLCERLVQQLAGKPRADRV